MRSNERNLKFKIIDFTSNFSHDLNQQGQQSGFQSALFSVSAGYPGVYSAITFCNSPKSVIFTENYTMNVKELDAELQEIERKKAELSKLNYNDPKYDDLEEELHDLEDDFQDKHGDHLEQVLQKIHDEHCPDNDVLLPIAYLGKGVPVEVDKYPGKDTRLVLVTSPLRIILFVGKERQDTVWTAK